MYAHAYFTTVCKPPPPRFTPDYTYMYVYMYNVHNVCIVTTNLTPGDYLRIN